MAALVATFLPLRVRGADLRELLLFPRFVDAREAAERRQEFMELMAHDKKADSGSIKYVLLNGLGGASTSPADEALVRQTLQEMGAGD